MRKLTLKGKDRSYNIYCGQDILKEIANLFDFGNGKICIITDSNVAPLYLDALKKALGRETSEFIFAAGEGSKNLNVCAQIYNHLGKNSFTKTDCLIALGGGVAGDMTGFVASTYLRGIKYYSVPTTLLAQVDSSVGGKCGIDIEYGKNLVGSFYQPYGVLADINTLKTLGKNNFADGMAETLKYGFIYDKKVYDMCLGDTDKNLSEIVFRCIEIKRDIVETDEFDSGVRMTLNFGHTIGHAVEALGNYSRYTHGQAVAIGMAYAAKLSEAAETASEGTYKKICSALERFNLPIKTDFRAKEILPVLLNDKKIRDGWLNFILLCGIGSSMIYKIRANEAYDFISKAL